MNKKKKTMLIVTIVMLVLLIALALGYTYAKYVGKFNLQASSSTAKWSFDGAISKDSNGTEKEISLADTTEGTSAVPGKLAPGSKGSFKIIIDANGSEVGVKYDVLFDGTDEKSKPVNLYFTCADLVNGKNQDGSLKKFYSLKQMLAVDESGNSNLSGTIDKNSTSTPKVITVNWEWPYESTREGMSADLIDQMDVNDSGKTDYTFNLKIIGKQLAEN